MGVPTCNHSPPYLPTSYHTPLLPHLLLVSGTLFLPLYVAYFMVNSDLFIFTSSSISTVTSPCSIGSLSTTTSSYTKRSVSRSILSLYSTEETDTEKKLHVCFLTVPPVHSPC